MKNIILPKKIIVGNDILEETKQFTKEHDSVLMVCDKGTAKIAGDKIASITNANTILIEKATKDEVERVKKEAARQKATILLGVGGGTVIDTTKLAAFETGTHYVSIPTSCAHDGMASPRASIKTQGTSVSMEAKPPHGILADLNIIKNAPHKFIAAGAGDCIAKYTAVKDWQLGHVIKGEYYGDYASRLSQMVGDIVIENAYEIKQKSTRGIGILIESLISSGAVMGIAGSSRPASGSEHKFSHALDSLGTSAMHGEQTGLGTIIMAYFHGGDWQRIKNALTIIGCPVTAKDIKIDESTILEALLNAAKIRPERYTILEHIHINREMAERALIETGVI